MKISKREIAVYLAEVKNAIQNDQYRIERNVHRQDNIDLFLAYIIDERKAKEILLDLTVEDFSEIRQNTHKGYEHEQLYVKEFISKAKEYIELPKLTPELLRTFIRRIEVFEKEEKYSRTCGNTIKIYYTFQV